jgi:hypothetical protein
VLPLLTGLPASQPFPPDTGPAAKQARNLHASRMKPAGAYDQTPGKLWPLLQADLRVHRTWLPSLAAPIRARGQWHRLCGSRAESEEHDGIAWAYAALTVARYAAILARSGGAPALRSLSPMSCQDLGADAGTLGAGFMAAAAGGRHE